MSSVDETSTTLFDLLAQLREDIATSQTKLDERGAAFVLQEVEIEAKVTLTKAGKFGLKLHVLTLGSDVKREQVHTVRLKVKPTDLFTRVAGDKPTPAPDVE
jgi:hypothetical protein